MKTRSGFVSNSSSSSFFIMAKEEDVNKALEQCHDYVKAVVEAIGKHKEFDGKKVVVFSGMTTMGGEGTFDYLDIDYDGEIPEDGYGSISTRNAFNKFEEELNKITKDIIASSEEM